MSEAAAVPEHPIPVLAIVAVVAGLVLTCLSGFFGLGNAESALYQPPGLERAEVDDSAGGRPPARRALVSDPHAASRLVGGILLTLSALASLAGCWLGWRRSGWRRIGGLAVLMVGLSSLPVEALLLWRGLG